jgi:hypothetical protein
MPRPLTLGVAGRNERRRTRSPTECSVQKEPFWPLSRVSPVGLRNTTTWYRVSPTSVMRVASSVLSTENRCSAPSALMVAMPCGIESWRISSRLQAVLRPTYDTLMPLSRSIGWSWGSTRNTSRQPGKPFSLSSPMLTISHGLARRDRIPATSSLHRT